MTVRLDVFSSWMTSYTFRWDWPAPDGVIQRNIIISSSQSIAIAKTTLMGSCRGQSSSSAAAASPKVIVSDIIDPCLMGSYMRILIIVILKNGKNQPLCDGVIHRKYLGWWWWRCLMIVLRFYHLPPIQPNLSNCGLLQHTITITNTIDYPQAIKHNIIIWAAEGRGGRRGPKGFHWRLQIKVWKRSTRWRFWTQQPISAWEIKYWRAFGICRVQHII